MQALLDWLRSRGWRRDNTGDAWSYEDWWVSPDGEGTLGIFPRNRMQGERILNYSLGTGMLAVAAYATDSPSEMLGYLRLILDYQDVGEDDDYHPVGPNYAAGAAELYYFGDGWR